jgi:hypothetical protein
VLMFDSSNLDSNVDSRSLTSRNSSSIEAIFSCPASSLNEWYLNADPLGFLRSEECRTMDDCGSKLSSAEFSWIVSRNSVLSLVSLSDFGLKNISDSEYQW